jgi:hypothetical protein
MHPVRLVLQLTLILIIGIAVLSYPVAIRAQRPDGLDAPLLAANRCGSGAADEVHFTIAATGDTFPHENIQNAAEALGYDWLFDNVRPYLQAADLAYTNFDGAMLASSPRSGYPNFNFNPALAPALKNAGIGLVSTANNHILDRGAEGLDATLAVLEAAGIQQHGAVRSDAIARPPYLPISLSTQGITITLGFVSATWGTNGIADPFNQVNLLYQSNSYGEQGGVRQSVLDAVAQAAADTDIVLVAAHWGYEYEFYPHPSQVEAARALAAAGADIILGAQSHTLQPVDIIETNGRNSLVIYSLANFLASQGAFQQQSFSATSVIFYIGLVRSPDGSVRLSGYRYLPTIHVDNDTRPAPILENTLPVVEDHVKLIMRDGGGLRRVAAVPPAGGERIAVCPSLRLAEAPEAPIPGDFAQHYATLGSGTTPRPLNEAIAIYGLPLGPPVRELSEDCASEVTVLHTERQRLELRPQQPWPYRVVGAQLGAAVYSQSYNATPVRLTDLTAADAFADPRFRTFYETYGGLNTFGYPISGLLQEGERSVQYFERARFELGPNGEVQLGLLSNEYKGIAAQCGLSAPPAANEPAPVTTTEEEITRSLGAVLNPTGSWWNNPWLLGLGAIAISLLGLLFWAGRGKPVRRTAYIRPRRPRRYRTARQRVLARRRAQAEADLLTRLLGE